MDRTPRDDAAVTRLQEEIQQLKTAVEALTLQRENINVQPQEESDHELNEWKEGFIPVFHGGQATEKFLDWITTIEAILEFKRVPLEQCAPLIALGFRGEAAAWWRQLKTSRARSGEPKILSWDNLKKEMRKTFLPLDYEQDMFKKLQNLRQGCRSVEEYYTEFCNVLRRVDLLHESDQETVTRFIGGLRRRIKHTLNLVSPLTLAEAYQKALTVEAQTKENIWSGVVALFAMGLFVYSSLRLTIPSTKTIVVKKAKRKQRRKFHDF